MHENDSLKLCPFCSSSAHFSTMDEPEEKAYYYIFCDEQDKCLCCMGPFKTKEEAMKAWNRRSYIELKLASVAEFLGGAAEASYRKWKHRKDIEK